MSEPVNERVAPGRLPNELRDSRVSQPPPGGVAQCWTGTEAGGPVMGRPAGRGIRVTVRTRSGEAFVDALAGRDEALHRVDGLVEHRLLGLVEGDLDDALDAARTEDHRNADVEAL